MKATLFTRGQTKKQKSLLYQQYIEGQSYRQAEQLPLISPTFQLLSNSRRQNPKTSPELGTNLKDLPFTATALAMPPPKRWLHYILHGAAPTVENRGAKEQRINANGSRRKAGNRWEICLRLFPSHPFPQYNLISWQHGLSSPRRECMCTRRLLRLAAEAAAAQLYRDVHSKLPLAKTGKHMGLVRGVKSVLPSAAGGNWPCHVFIHSVWRHRI